MTSDPRTHFYVATCAQCEDWVFELKKAPMRARMLAMAHARKFAGHETYVFDLTALEVVKTYRFEIQISLLDNEPDF